MGLLNANRVIAAIEAMAQSCPDDWDGQFRALIRRGFGEAEAHRVISFFPPGLSRPVLEKLGVIEFVDIASVPLECGGQLEFRLSDQPEYVAALKAARDHLANGTLPQNAFKVIVLSSADVDAVSNALDEGEDVEGAVIATAFLDARLAKHVVR